eukprot:scaffold15895_cov37-Tisochrysis_lutea.AAC.2
MRHAPPLTRLPHHVQEAIEREEIKGEFIRSVLRNVAALLAMGFVLWLVYSRLKQLRNAQLGRSAAKLGTGYRAPDKAEVMKSASTQKGDSFVTTPQKPNGEILRKSDGSPFPSGPIKTQEELLKAAAASRALYEKTIATPPGSSRGLQHGHPAHRDIVESMLNFMSVRGQAKHERAPLTSTATTWRLSRARLRAARSRSTLMSTKSVRACRLYRGCCADASNGPVHRTACKSRHYLQIQRGAAVSLKDCLLETSCQYSHAAACSDLDPSQAQRDCCSEQARFGLACAGYRLPPSTFQLAFIEVFTNTTGALSSSPRPPTRSARSFYWAQYETVICMVHRATWLRWKAWWWCGVLVDIDMWGTWC